MWARIENGMVWETIKNNPSGSYPENLVWVPVPEEIQKYISYGSWSYSEQGGFVADLAAVKERMRQILRDMRWSAEQRPVEVDGRMFSAARPHRQLLAEYITHAKITGALLPFKLYDGQWWTPTSLSVLELVYERLLAAVSDSFQKEHEAISAINAAETLDAIQTAFDTHAQSILPIS